MSRPARRRTREEQAASYRRAAQRPMPCPVCRLPWATRELIELSCRSGAAVRWIADHYGLSRGQIRRHLDRCHGGHG